MLCRSEAALCQDEWNKSEIGVSARSVLWKLCMFSSHKVKLFHKKSISVSPGCLFLALKHLIRTCSITDVTFLTLFSCIAERMWFSGVSKDCHVQQKPQEGSRVNPECKKINKWMRASFWMEIWSKNKSTPQNVFFLFCFIKTCFVQTSMKVLQWILCFYH